MQEWRNGNHQQQVAVVGGGTHKQNFVNMLLTNKTHVNNKKSLELSNEILVVMKMFFRT